MRLPILGRRIIERHRFGTPVLDAFRRKTGAISRANITVSIQPAPKAVLERLGSGYTSDNTVQGITYDDIRSGREGQEADHILVGAGSSRIEYQVIEVSDSPAFAGVDPHRVFVAKRLQVHDMPEPA